MRRFVPEVCHDVRVKVGVDASVSFGFHKECAAVPSFWYLPGNEFLVASLRLEDVDHNRFVIQP